MDLIEERSPQEKLIIAKTLIESVLDELPSAQPTIEERKVGKWEEREVHDGNAIEEWQSARCSVCGKYHTTPYMYFFSEYMFCPHCGSPMERDYENKGDDD